jgi:hypothetical protein
MTLCSVCGQVVAATVPCYDGAHRCLPCAAGSGFAWRSADHMPAELYREPDDPPAPRRRPRRGVPAPRTTQMPRHRR